MIDSYINWILSIILKGLNENKVLPDFNQSSYHLK